VFIYLLHNDITRDIFEERGEKRDKIDVSGYALNPLRVSIRGYEFIQTYNHNETTGDDFQFSIVFNCFFGDF
jgi:hypothetical protein